MSAGASMVVLVTGCSSGFGRQIMCEAAAAGHKVFAGFRDVADATALPEGVVAVALDVTNAAQRAAAVAQVLAEAGRLDALVNNAGVVLGGYAEALCEDELRHVMEVNFFGAFLLTQAALPALRESRGVIVNISSISGLRAFPGLGGYAASKFAVEGWSESLAQELEHFGVRVHLVEPGTFRTEIWQRNRTLGRRTFDPDSPYAELVPRLDAAFDASADRTAGDPAEVAAHVLALLTIPSPRLRHVLWGNRRARILFNRLQTRVAPELPEQP